MFPLRGAILLPRASLTFNVFEPRYLALVDHALAGNRLIGVIQPTPEAGSAESPQGKTFPLRHVGCVGKITSFAENEDDRVVISLSGVARFRVAAPLQEATDARNFGFDRGTHASSASWANTRKGPKNFS